MKIWALSGLIIMCFGILMASGKGKGKGPSQIPRLERKIDKLIRKNRQLKDDVKKCSKEIEDLRNWLCKAVPKLCCDYMGERYLFGDTFPKGDACNTCYCRGNNTVGCTILSCGGCPAIVPGTIVTCAESCTSQGSCPAGQFCCFNGCGRECMDIVVATKPDCPKDEKPFNCILPRVCPPECPKGQVCCKSDCGYRCTSLSPNPDPCSFGTPLIDPYGRPVNCEPSKHNCTDGFECTPDSAGGLSVCCPGVIPIR